MRKFTALALVAAGMVAASTLFAQNTPAPATTPPAQTAPATHQGTHNAAPAASPATANTAQNGCVALNIDSLNLKPDQKSQLEAARADAVKAGCTPQARKSLMKKAKSVLSKEELGRFKAACVKAGMKKERDKSKKKPKAAG